MLVKMGSQLPSMNSGTSKSISYLGPFEAFAEAAADKGHHKGRDLLLTRPSGASAAAARPAPAAAAAAKARKELKWDDISWVDDFVF